AQEVARAERRLEARQPRPTRLLAGFAHDALETRRRFGVNLLGAPLERDQRPDRGRAELHEPPEHRLDPEPARPGDRELEPGQGRTLLAGGGDELDRPGGLELELRPAQRTDPQRAACSAPAIQPQEAPAASSIAPPLHPALSRPRPLRPHAIAGNALRLAHRVG